jgi:putative flippase GtrA
MIETQMRREAERARGTRHRRGAPLRPSTDRHPLHVLLRSRAARPLRFALTGGLAGLLQLSLLTLLLGRGWPAAPANALAFLLAAQVNFALSSLFTWRDRRRTASLWRRWLAFHGAIAAMALVNQSVFLAVRTALPALVASAAGIAVAAVGNYLLGDRLVFGVHGHQRRSSLFLTLSSPRRTADALVRQHRERPAIMTPCPPDEGGRSAGAALSSDRQHPVSETSSTYHGTVMAPSYAEGVLMSGRSEESPSRYHTPKEK